MTRRAGNDDDVPHPPPPAAATNAEYDTIYIHPYDAIRRPNRKIRRFIDRMFGWMSTVFSSESTRKRKDKSRVISRATRPTLDYKRRYSQNMHHSLGKQMIGDRDKLYVSAEKRIAAHRAIMNSPSLENNQVPSSNKVDYYNPTYTQNRIQDRLKVVVLGSSRVGKTSLIKRYHSNVFKGSEYRATIDADFKVKEIRIPLLVGNNKVEGEYFIQIWDSVGQGRFKSQWTSFYRRAHACVLVYDITDPKSFEALDELRNQFLQDTGNDKCPFILLGNKTDLNDTFFTTQRRVTRTDAEEWCTSRGNGKAIPYYETSAKTASSVEAAFMHIAKIALLQAEHEKKNHTVENNSLENNPVSSPLVLNPIPSLPIGDNPVPSSNDFFLSSPNTTKYWAQDMYERREADCGPYHDTRKQSNIDQGALVTKQTIQFVEIIKSQFDMLSCRPSIYSSSIQTMGEDNMFFMAKKFILCKNDFQQDGICSEVSFGFHYTKERNIQAIQRDGLMTRNERAKDPSGAKDQSRSKDPSKLVFGDGIYVGNNYHAFQDKRYGPIGLFVAILKGRCVSYFRRPHDRSDFDTIIGNKKEVASENGSGFHDEIVLQRSCQCLPLLRFDSNDVHGMSKLATYTMCLQASVDKFLNSQDWHRNMNQTFMAPMETPCIETHSESFEHSVRNMHETFVYMAPHSLVAEANEDRLFCAVTCGENSDIQAECPICLQDMNENDCNIVGLNIDGCNHRFHRHCIESSIQVTPKCPVCRKGIVEPQGQSPSGSLVVKVSPTVCSGFEGDSTSSFVLTYTMSGGIQKCYHPSPGTRYRGTVRTAYIPDVSEGRRLLKRLVYAFDKGLTFMVGTSMTTGMENSITWSSIHHKTNLYGGVQKHGYPDKFYLMNCHEELDSLDVPRDPCSSNSGIINML